MRHLQTVCCLRIIDLRINTTNPILEFDEAQKQIAESLSAVVVVGGDLWVASDETTSVERLSSTDGITFNSHKSFPLEDLIDLPAQDTDADQEIDIEGLDHHDSYLWLVGSHSIKRKKVKEGETTEKNFNRLATPEIKGNRFILARVPLLESDPDRVLKSAQLEGDLKSNALVDAIKQANNGKGDPHFSGFLTTPGKDNGFDIEGLAISGERIFLGLRGPVLRGWAGILEVAVAEADSRLKLRETGPEGRPYKKHFLDLDGLGVRDICVDEPDLLILAGPTMDLDGPVAVYRWPDALASSKEQLVSAKDLERLFVVPNGAGVDHAEGMALIADPKRLLIVYDSPSKERKISDRAVKADVFDLPNNRT